MKNIRRWIVAGGVLLAVWIIVAGGLHGAAASRGLFDGMTSAWRENAIWHDGKAECAVYDATRDIYGQTRSYQALFYTNRELADPDTKTKAADGAHRNARAVFKHHLRENIPTENYDYHFSTMCYVGVDDLKSLKLDMGSQEDCGATFKQFVNHAGELTWLQCSYFPSEGRREGGGRPPADFVFHDALSLILRSYPFDDQPELTLMVLPDQTTTRLTPTDAKAHRVRYVGLETLDLPIGATRAHHLEVSPATSSGDAARSAMEHYWFAADGQPPTLHAMVQYEGPGGQTLRLRELERRAYWKR